MELSNRRLAVELSDRGVLRALRREDGFAVGFQSEEIRITTDRGSFSTQDAPPKDIREGAGCVEFHYGAPGFRVKLIYRLESEWSFIKRYIEIENEEALSVYLIECVSRFDEEPREVIDYHTFWNCPTVAFARTGHGGLYTGFEHPYFEAARDGRALRVAFEPSLILAANEGYLSEANFFGLYLNTGNMMIQQSPATGMRLNDVSHTRYRNPSGHIALDRGEVEAFSEYARDYLEVRTDRFLLIFYQFFITLPQQPETDEDERLYYHYIDNFVRMGGDLVTFNPLVRNVPPRPAMDGAWALAPEGSRAERILNYARDKGLDIGFYMGSAAGNSAYCTSPMTPFALENKRHWKKRDRMGGLSSENCIASDDFANWFYQVQHNTIAQYGITLWDWDPGPGNGFFCYSADHGHIPGKGAYKGFRNAMNVVKRLKDDFPRLYIQGFHGTKEYGLWGFRGFDQHEAYWEQCPYDMCTVYPDFSEDRLTASGMRFQSAWNQLFRFMPPEQNHALASRMTQYCLMPGELRKLYDKLHWKYAFFSALAVGSSMTVTMIPEHLEDVEEYEAYFKKWIPWARQNFDLARYSKPFGAQSAAGAMDGFARLHEGRGFLFLFNPGPTHVDAQFALDSEIGLDRPGEYVLIERYPGDGMAYYDEKFGRCIYRCGDSVGVSLKPFGFKLLELRGAAEEDKGPTLCNIEGRLTIEGTTARIDGCRGEAGTEATGVIAGAGAVERVVINGREMPFERRGGELFMTLHFGPEKLPTLLTQWAARDGRRVNPMDHAAGALTVRADFELPASIKERLDALRPADEAAHRALIARMKSALRRENFAWAEPHRLHLTIPFAEPHRVENLSCELNGQRVKLELVDTRHAGVQAKILYFADITDQVRFGGENQLTISADRVDEDGFLGAMLDYPEGKPTEEVHPCAREAHPASTGPIGQARRLRAAELGERAPIIESAWIAQGMICENAPYTVAASVNMGPDALEGVYLSAQISIDAISGQTLRADEALAYDPASGLWKCTLLPPSRKLLIIDGKDLHLWAVTKEGIVGGTRAIQAEWHLQSY